MELFLPLPDCMSLESQGREGVALLLARPETSRKVCSYFPGVLGPGGRDAPPGNPKQPQGETQGLRVYPPPS